MILPQCVLHPILIISFLKNNHTNVPLYVISTQDTFSYVRNIELTVKSSRACAPRLSFLASAECIVIHALIKRFSSSIVSTKSEFLKCKVSKTQLNNQPKDNSLTFFLKEKQSHHIKLLSFTLTSPKLSQVLSIKSQPILIRKF